MRPRSCLAAGRPCPRLRSAPVWRAATGGQIRSRPAVGPDGTTYALSEDSFLYAWVSGGSLLWKHDLGWIPWDCLAVSRDGTVYAGLKNADFIAVNPRGGRLWTVRLDGLPAGDPGNHAGRHRARGNRGGNPRRLFAPRKAEWSVTLPGAITAQPVIDGAGSIYLVAADRRLYALTPWGEFKWSLPFSAVPGAPAITSDGSVVLGTDGGEVVAVSPAGERLVEEVPRRAGQGRGRGRACWSSPTRAAAASSGSPPTGRELWRREAAKPVGAPPLLDGAASFSRRWTAPSSPSTRQRARSRRLAQGTAAGRASPPTERSSSAGATGSSPPCARPLTGLLPSVRRPRRGRRPATTPCIRDGRMPPRARATVRFSMRTPTTCTSRACWALPAARGSGSVLADVGGRVASRSLGKSTWYTVRMLENVAGLGLVVQSRLNQKLVNDFPDLRAEAAGLLGRVGSTSSRDALLRAVRAETDGVALAAEIRALGAIASDGDGASLRAILQAFTRRAALPPDSRLAAAVVDAVARIAVYEGTIAEPSAVTTLRCHLARRLRPRPSRPRRFPSCRVT